MDRKRLVREYKETPRPAGLFLVQHIPSGRRLYGTSPDAPAMLNRIRAQLRTQGHPNRALQGDWNRDGADAFRFEVLDLLPPPESPDYEPTADLKVLMELWRDRLEGEPGSKY